MSLDHVPDRRDVPHDCNVVIGIPMRADPIKYEVDNNMRIRATIGVDDAKRDIAEAVARYDSASPKPHC